MTKLETQLEFDLPRTICELCGSSQIQWYYKDYKGINIFQCSNCGIKFMNPQYSDAHLQSYYSSFTVEEVQWNEALHYCHHFYLSIIERFAPKRGKMLDIGSGNGYVLTVAKERGWIPLGYDVSEISTKDVSHRIGIPILSSDFLSLAWKKEAFDLIYMHQVLEHLKYPSKYFDIIDRTIKKGGIIFIAVPNIASISVMFKHTLERFGMRKNNIGAWFGTDGHLWYYSPNILREFLQRRGYEVLHVRSGHRVRPNQSRLKRFLLRTVVEKFPWKSTFLMIARKL